MERQKPLIELRNAGVKIGDTWILRDISFTLERGEVFAVVGHSGSGKSTLLRCINRLTETDAGCVLFNDRDIRDIPPPELRRKAGMVFQLPAVFPGTVRENIEYGLKLWNENFSETDVLAALTDAGLDPPFLERNAEKLSGGEQQRVCLARTLALGSEALLLDEPTSSLDAKVTRRIEATVKGLREKRGLGILWVTHDMEQAGRVADKAMVLKGGRLMARGRVEDIVEEELDG